MTAKLPEGLSVLIGAHVSVAGGFTNGLEYALSIGAECLQFFAKSPRQWRAPSLDATRVAAFREGRARTGFGPVFSHTAYLLNLSTIDDDLRAKSVAALADEISRGAALGADGVVTHIGNDTAGDPTAAAARVGESIREAFAVAGDAAHGTRLLLENTAGAGTTYGSTFEELAAAIEAADIGAAHLGVCLDTCHAFAYGFPLDSEDGWRELVLEIDQTVGLERLGLVHANDCMYERGSRRDRHAWIGDGYIGETGFSAMLCTPEIASVPAVTEMPGEVPEKDVVNLERLKALRELCSSSQS